MNAAMLLLLLLLLQVEPEGCSSCARVRHEPLQRCGRGAQHCQHHIIGEHFEALA
jgi:hypothetical protein